ncbi:MAG: biotin--[acetyl-CoA-carboxylase] ligase [Spirochaetes bacterium]|nr:biotin--[acetyl-CoA-carboxylase] ligase [Spirochaetota bacterium]
MVNNELVIQHRAKVLNILRSASKPVSIKILSGELGITRVALWKLIRKLEELGYPIEGSRNGYYLPKEHDPDLLCPWELEPYGSRIEWFFKVTSTMEEAKRFSRTNTHAPQTNPFYTIAETQTEGRGRFQRTWESPLGGIYFTLSIHRTIPLAIVGRYPLLAGAILVETLQAILPGLSGASDPHAPLAKGISLKWPNDIMIGKRKLGGILLDMDVEGDTVTGIYLGIGINIRNRTIGPNGVSLIDLFGQSVPPKREILLHYLRRLEKALEDPYLKSAIPKWKRFSSTLGKPVRIRFPEGSRAGLTGCTGIAVDLGSGGELVVQTSDGSLRIVNYGDCY